ncbi:MAG: homocysteine S-methyltransferase family protein [Eubacterium sp.]
MCLKNNKSIQLKRMLEKEYLIFDGGYGTRMVEAGLCPGERPEMWNFTHENEVLRFHREYLEAGCHLIKTNTFGANPLSYQKELEKDPDFLDRLIEKGVFLAKKAVMDYEKQWEEEWGNTKEQRFCAVALDIGPCGRLLEPLGDLDFEQAVRSFAQVVRTGVKCGVDCILIETMTDSYETKAAVLAAKENSDLPVFVTNTYQENGKLLTGTSILGMIALLEGLGVDAIGMNCGLGPSQMEELFEVFEKHASIPVIINPNAGLPVSDGERVRYPNPEDFLKRMENMINRGARIVGGCCGTTPEHIRGLSELVSGKQPQPLIPKTETLITSSEKVVEFGKKPVLIGERINPTGKKRLQQALREQNMEYIISLAQKQKERFAQVLDVNVGLPEINEKEVLPMVTEQLRQSVNLPLQLDSSDPEALEAAMRIYNGKPMVNSVNGKEESMQAVFPLVKKYGGLVVALTLDEQGIPSGAEGRLAIAKRIYETAAGYGISPKDIIIDPLAMAVSADPGAATETLSAVRMMKEQLGGLVSLGVSNVSFGLPERENLNAVFFASALECGLDAAIMNPDSDRMLQTYFGFCALHQMDEQFSDYIKLSGQRDAVSQTFESSVLKSGTEGRELYDAVKKGWVKQAETAAGKWPVIQRQ